MYPCVQLANLRVCVCVCRLLQDILRYIHSVARCVEENAGKPTAKFWRVLLNKAYDVLDKVRIHILYFGQKYRYWCTKYTQKVKVLIQLLYFSQSKKVQVLKRTK